MNAVLWMTGERLWSTGQPITPTRWVAPPTRVRPSAKAGLVVQEGRVGRAEPQPRLPRALQEVEVAGLRRRQRPLERLDARARDARRWQPGVQPGVVRAVDLEVRDRES